MRIPGFTNRIALRSSLKRLTYGVFRLVERLCPVFLLGLLLWPLAASLAAWNLLCRRFLIPQFRRLPPSLRPCRSLRAWIWRCWCNQTRIEMAMFPYHWRDRLRQRKWQRCVRWTGVNTVEEILATGRPVVLVTLHYGPFHILGSWLRSRSLQIAALHRKSVGERSAFERSIEQASNRAYGLRDLPHYFDVTQIRPLHEFLQPGRVLCFAIDGRKGHNLPAGDEDFRLPLATGPLRLAAARGAVVVPCLIHSPRTLHCSIHVGQPVPDAWVNHPSQHLKACTHLLHEFLLVMRAHPEQCAKFLLDQIQALPPSERRAEPRATELSVVGKE